MAKMRIHEFAKELDMPGKDVITILEKLGEIGKTVSSSIDDELQDKVRKHMSRGDNAMKTDKPVKAEEKPAPAGPAEASKPVRAVKPAQPTTPSPAASVAGKPAPQGTPVPKKKKNIIIVNNHQNVRGGSSRDQGVQGRNGGQGQNRQDQRRILGMLSLERAERQRKRFHPDIRQEGVCKGELVPHADGVVNGQR